MFILPDYPSSPVCWLTPTEHALAQKRMEEDSEGHGPVEPKASALSCCNASMWFNMFFPTLVATMGYSSTISLLLCAPPWIVSTITAVTVTRCSDAKCEHFWHMVFALSMLITGYTLAMSTMNINVHYISLSVTNDILLTWISNMFTRSSSKRAVAIGYIWSSSWSLTYTNSTCILLCWVFRQHFE
ncbi:hypothetical protein DFH29DRAFT_985214 [Suillus ampliporus]|nr:hypothetical protein DFH29DRAFT_985214 [Suillus ampliporus]